MMDIISVMLRFVVSYNLDIFENNFFIVEKDDCSTHCPGTGISNTHLSHENIIFSFIDYQSSMCKFYCQLEVWRQQATTCGLSLPVIVPQVSIKEDRYKWSGL